MATDDLQRILAVIGAALGAAIRAERRRRRWSLADLAARSGVSKSHICWIENGHPGSLEAYVRLARALRLEPVFELADHRRRSRSGEDPVHAAMGEVIADRMLGFGLQVALDEPYQHYQFAGRADVLAWSLQDRALLHVEDRTRYPNIQEAFGSYNAKRRFLPAFLADRLGIRGGFRSVTHVMAGLWSSEVIHAVRMHRASFRATCPDETTPFRAWWDGGFPPPGSTSTFVLLDPGASRPRARTWVGLEEIDRVRPRYPGYAKAREAVHAA